MTKNLLTITLAMGIPALAQTTIKDALVKHWKVTTDFTIAVAKQMPADSYNFRPVPEELSFSQLIVQIGGANMSACSAASGMQAPAIRTRFRNRSMRKSILMSRRTPPSSF